MLEFQQDVKFEEGTEKLINKRMNKAFLRVIKYATKSSTPTVWLQP